MESFTSILIVLSFFGMILAFIGIIKGSIKFLKIKNRKNSAILFISFFILMFIGGVLALVDNSIVAPQNTESQTEGTTTGSSNVAGTLDSVNSTEINDVSNEVSSSDNIKETDSNQVVVSPSPTDVPEVVVSPLPTEKLIIETLTIPTGLLEVHYIDVGQGAAQLIITPSGKIMLIDAGNNDDEQRMVNYLKEQGVTKVDILVGTHPDADHVGGLDAVVDAFEIGSIYMPKVTSNTKTFESLLTSISNKNLKVTTAKAGLSLNLDEQLTVNILAPISTYADANEMSVVIKLTFGSNSFLFTGDADVKSEHDLLASGTDLKSDVLLVGHHGSNSSTSKSFLDAVNPQYAVIQVGKNNYGHPTNETLQKLSNKGIKIYRNDEQGNIIFTSDGKNVAASQVEWKLNSTTATSKPGKAITQPRATKVPTTTFKPVEQPKQESVSYANCTAVREAGKAPLYEGDPGYSTKLDRDKDGVACE